MTLGQILKVYHVLLIALIQSINLGSHLPGNASISAHKTLTFMDIMMNNVLRDALMDNLHKILLDYALISAQMSTMYIWIKAMQIIWLIDVFKDVQLSAMPIPIKVIAYAWTSVLRAFLLLKFCNNALIFVQTIRMLITIPIHVSINALMDNMVTQIQISVWICVMYIKIFIGITLPTFVYNNVPITQVYLHKIRQCNVYFLVNPEHLPIL